MHNSQRRGSRNGVQNPRRGYFYNNHPRRYGTDLQGINTNAFERLPTKNSKETRN